MRTVDWVYFCLISAGVQDRLFGARITHQVHFSELGQGIQALSGLRFPSEPTTLDVPSLWLAIQTQHSYPSIYGSQQHGKQQTPIGVRATYY